MAEYTIKQHDTWPPLEATLSDANGPVDITTATVVKLILRKSGSLTAELAESCEVVNAPGGRVRYVWDSGDTDVSGIYQGEFEITWDDLTVETFPNSAYFSVEVVPDLG